MRGLCAVTVGALLVTAVGCAEQAARPSDEGGAGATPNVVLIVVDTLRSDHMGLYGYERATTPRIDDLSADAVVFRQAVATTSWTTPSMASILTSRYPTEVSPEYPPVVLPDHVLRLPQLFRERGQVTGAVVSHLLVGRELQFDVGFDSFDQEEARGHDHVSSPGVTGRAIAFLEQHRDEPFFLFVHYFDPHYNFLRHEGFDFSSDYAGPVSSGMPIRELERLAPELEPADWEFVRALYDSEIAFTDHYIGLLLRRLEELELYRDALVVLTADHGEEFGERDLIGHGHHLHGEVVNVPLVIKPPGGAEHRIVETPVSLIDLAPTICELSGVTWPAEHLRHGVPIPIDADVAFEGAPVISELGPAHTVLADGWKLMTADTVGGTRLYRLTEDPAERRDVIGEDTETASRLRLELERWSAALQPECDGTTPEFSEEQRDKLRALGYAQ
jgi:arylsulfatase A-like enzyme